MIQTVKNVHKLHDCGEMYHTNPAVAISTSHTSSLHTLPYPFLRIGAKQILTLSHYIHVCVYIGDHIALSISLTLAPIKMFCFCADQFIPHAYIVQHCIYRLTACKQQKSYDSEHSTNNNQLSRSTQLV